MGRWSRRKFLETGLLGSVTSLPELFRIAGKISGERDETLVSSKNATNQRNSLIAVLDTIIPDGHGMPCASKAGCLQYFMDLSNRDKGFKEDFETILETLNDFIGKFRRVRFSNMPKADRIATLKMFEREHSDAFEKLRMYTYEAYYTQPSIRRLIGYEPHPTNQAGVVLAFDEQVLAAVRNRPKHYREI